MEARSLQRECVGVPKPRVKMAQAPWQWWIMAPGSPWALEGATRDTLVGLGLSEGQIHSQSCHRSPIAPGMLGTIQGGGAVESKASAAAAGGAEPKSTNPGCVWAL